jgi:crotonobetainyl-CoA:carnitine CoA-transferase CaiB-like acyl-CoA transferase
VFRLLYDEAMTNAATPLDGLVVLDFTHTLAGPCCTVLMATCGANVVTVAGA